jgi:Right handed beta helix region
VQRLLDANPSGTRFCFHFGTYRFAGPIHPKAGQQLAGVAGTILDGAKLISSFAASRGNFVAIGFLQGGRLSSTNCLVAKSGCDTPQDVFLGGKPLTRVMSVGRLTTGTFYENFAHNQIWLHDDPRHRPVEQAFASAIVESVHDDVTVEHLTIEMAASPAQHGAILARGARWTIRDDEIRYNHGAGVTLSPHIATQGGSKIVGSFIHDNGQEGIGANGPDITIEENEIARNNRVGYSCYWECGGAKFACGSGCEVRNLLVVGNYVHDNAGDGFWTDINTYNVTFRHNLIVNNRQTDAASGLQIGAGIFLEISDRGTIADNVLKDNGPVANSQSQALFYEGAQILLSATPNVDVHDNQVTGAVGIGMLQQDRHDSCQFGTKLSTTYPDGTPVCPYRYHYCPKNGSQCTDNHIHLAHDNRIHNNAFIETAASGNADVAGLDSDLENNAPIFAPSNANLYDANTYRLPTIDGRYYDWNNATTAKGPWLRAGQDARSTFVK